MGITMCAAHSTTLAQAQGLFVTSTGLQRPRARSLNSGSINCMHACMACPLTWRCPVLYDRGASRGRQQAEEGHAWVGASVRDLLGAFAMHGMQNTEDEAFQQLDYALSRGVNFVDTAEMYLPRASPR